MSDNIKSNISLVKKIRYSFPFQLFLLHIKKSHFILLIWFFTTGIILDFFLQKYGAKYLFLSPEYKGLSDTKAFMVFGFSTGGFIMAFHMYTYVTHAFRFPFIATVRKPFFTFCINNSVIPLIYIIIYSVSLIHFSYNSENLSAYEISFNLLAYYIGMLTFMFLAFSYFFRTNKDFIKFGKNENVFVESTLKIDDRWRKSESHAFSWKVYTFFNKNLELKIARDLRHYNHKLFNQILSQNHTNTSIFEILVILSFLTVSYFSDNNSFLKIPAASSFFLALTFITMIFSAFYSWFKGWTLTVIILLILSINYFTEKTNVLEYNSYSYGLNYDTTKAKYNIATLDNLSYNKQDYLNDSIRGIEILENWKAKQNNEKPKLVLLNTTGGGLRSSLWTFSCLQHIDSLENGSLLDKIHLITGASGGMLGAAYYRELYNIKKSSSINTYDKKYNTKLGADLLNSIGFSIATNDIFFRYKKVSVGPYKYSRDRAYAFEQNLNENLDNVFNKKLIEYERDEYNSNIPLMIFTPTIVNDGRQLIISSQKLNYLTKNNLNHTLFNDEVVPSAIEYIKMFGDQGALETKFTSVIRMSATFPYILPITSLPSDPPMDIMDAGIRDNTGAITTINYLFAFKDWIQENTSGVIIIRISDTDISKEKNKSKNTLFKRLSLPINALYGNFFNIQNYRYYDELNKMNYWFKNNLTIFDLNLDRGSNHKNISLSWHLSTKEKKLIQESVFSKSNIEVINKIQKEIK